MTPHGKCAKNEILHVSHRFQRCSAFKTFVGTHKVHLANRPATVAIVVVWGLEGARTSTSLGTGN
ncbi:MAG: hypothetical protein Kow0074_18680 [Candidatus Zixiibacteriota bacterium]